MVRCTLLCDTREASSILHLGRCCSCMDVDSARRLNLLIRRMTITMIARMINNMIALIVNIHPFPIKVKHRPKQSLSKMFLFDLFIFWGKLLISGEWDYAHDLNRISNVTVMSIIWSIVVMNGSRGEVGIVPLPPTVAVEALLINRLLEPASSEFLRLESLDCPGALQLQPSWDENFAAILGATASFQLRISMCCQCPAETAPQSLKRAPATASNIWGKLTFENQPDYYYPSLTI